MRCLMSDAEIGDGVRDRQMIACPEGSGRSRRVSVPASNAVSVSGERCRRNGSAAKAVNDWPGLEITTKEQAAKIGRAHV